MELTNAGNRKSPQPVRNAPPCSVLSTRRSTRFPSMEAAFIRKAAGLTDYLESRRRYTATGKPSQDLSRISFPDRSSLGTSQCSPKRKYQSPFHDPLSSVATTAASRYSDAQSRCSLRRVPAKRASCDGRNQSHTGKAETFLLRNRYKGDAVREEPVRPFQELLAKIRERKGHGKHVENMPDFSWDEHRCVTESENYETGVWRQLNQTVIQQEKRKKSVTAMYREDPMSFHKHRAIAEFADLAHSFASNRDRHYIASVKKEPMCFRKKNGRFTAAANLVAIKCQRGHY